MKPWLRLAGLAAILSLAREFTSDAVAAWLWSAVPWVALAWGLVLLAQLSDGIEGIRRRLEEIDDHIREAAEDAETLPARLADEMADQQRRRRSATIWDEAP